MGKNQYRLIVGLNTDKNIAKLPGLAVEALCVENTLAIEDFAKLAGGKSLQTDGFLATLTA